MSRALWLDRLTRMTCLALSGRATTGQGEGDRSVGGVCRSLLFRRARLRRQHAPVDELLGELTRCHVVDDRQRPEVLRANGEDLAVVVAPLALDGRGVSGEWPDLLRRQLLQSFQVDHDLGGGLGPRRHAALWQ